MESTISLRIDNDPERTREIDIFGKKIRVKNYICSTDGINYRRKPDKVKLQLSVMPTSFCPGNCPFCIAKDTKRQDRMDIERFASVVRELKAADVVRGVKITGGEPFYDMALLNEVVSVLFEVFGTELELSISTNGMRISRLTELNHLEHIETIHISRHHYDDAANSALFGGVLVPGKEELKEAVSSVSFKDIFVFNCMMLKSGISTKEDAHRFLDFAIDIGVPKVGFMECAKINYFAEREWVPVKDAINDDDDRLLFTRGFFDYGFCSCRDGVYVSQSGDIIEFYIRNTTAVDCEYSRGLTYGADGYLRDGYGGTIIY